MTSQQGSRSLKPYVYMVIATVMLAFSVIFLLWSVSYMERGRVATSLISALAGFSLLTGSLYVYRLASYIYAIERGE